MSSQDGARRRQRGREAVRDEVRLSVGVPRETHAKLCALAALRGVDRSVLAAGFVEKALRGVVLTVRGPDPSEADDNAA